MSSHLLKEELLPEGQLESSSPEVEARKVAPVLHLSREIIKIIGVGGAGNNAINHIIRSGTYGTSSVEFIAANTDLRCLEQSSAQNKLVLGKKLTKGLGAGAMPDVGRDAAIESAEEIRSMLRGADMVYLAAGMGGGTGTGAAPVIASMAKEMGILSVAVVTRPFSFEGPRRSKHAASGIKALSECVDALITVSNDKLLNMAPDDFPLQEAFRMVDDVLLRAVYGVTSLIVKPGVINVDFADLRTVMENAGAAVMGIGSAKGENRARVAVQKAMSSPLMDIPMDRAKGILLNVTGGPDLSIHEVNEAAEILNERLADEGTFVWGFTQEEGMEGCVEMVVVGTGFDTDTPQVAPEASQKTAKTEAPQKRTPLSKNHSHVPREGVAEERTEAGLFAQTPVHTYDSPSVWRRKG